MIENEQEWLLLEVSLHDAIQGAGTETTKVRRDANPLQPAVTKNFEDREQQIARRRDLPHID